jgi:hypothetical protein
MLKYGEAPYLECSTQGDRRFSAFVARIESRNARTIESIYQAAKIFNGGVTGLDWRSAKGRKADNQKEVEILYSQLWDEYIEENPHLLDVLKSQSGLSDMFGREGHCCQATELWRIRNGNVR